MAFSDYNLNANPFRNVPGIQSEDLIWAGFKDIKTKFEDRIKRAIRVRNSGLLLNWGEYGSGKTHAARFFGKKSELQRLADEINGTIPFHVYLTLPKGRAPIEDIFISIIDKIDIEKIREVTIDFRNDIYTYLDSTFDDTFVKASIKAVFSDEDPSLIKGFLYGSLSSKELRDLRDINILRGFKSENDYIKFLSGLFSILTLDKKAYSCIILWIDEFEDIATLTNATMDKINSFLRETFDNTPNNLLVILNLTQSSLFTAEDLGSYISEAVKSRIRDRIYFDIPSEVQLMEYLTELLSEFRINNDPSKLDLFPFDINVVHSVFSDFRNVSIRRYNDIFSTLLELADLDSVPLINTQYYEQNKSEIIGYSI